MLGFILLWTIPVNLGHAQVTNLTNGQSINFSQLTGANPFSVQVGDKLFGNFSVQYSDNDGNTGNDLTASAFSLTALSNQIGYGISFTGPFVANGNVFKDAVFRYSIAVTNSSQLISDIHLDFNGTVVNGGFSTVTEDVFTGGFGGTLLTQIDVFSLGTTNQLTAAANFLTPQTKVFIQKDITYGGNATNDMSNISVVDQVFSQIPEPSTIVLSLAGLASLFFLKRRP